MTDAQKIYDEYKSAWPDLDTALKVASLEIASLGRKVSGGYARAVREAEPRPGKLKPPAIRINGEPDA